MAKKRGKVAKVMGEFKRGTLRSGSKKGPRVTSRKQAQAIGLSEARKAGERVGKAPGNPEPTSTRMLAARRGAARRAGRGATRPLAKRLAGIPI